MKVSILYLFVFLAAKKQVTGAFAYSFFFINLGFLPIGFIWNLHTFLRLLWDNDCIGLFLNFCSNATDIKKKKISLVFLPLSIYLRFVYFVETKNFLLKVL